MDKKVFIGMYHNDSELMKKINDLKAQGIDGENIYLIAQDDSDVTMFQGMKYGDVQTTPDSWFARFLDFLTGENHVRSMLQEVGVPEEDMDNYYREIESGGKLLYVDQGELHDYHAKTINQFGMMNEGTDPNLGANRVTPEDYKSPSSTHVSNRMIDPQAPLGRVGGEAMLTFNPATMSITPGVPQAPLVNPGALLSKDPAQKELEEQRVINEEIVNRQQALHEEVVHPSDAAVVHNQEASGESEQIATVDQEVKIQKDDKTIRVPLEDFHPESPVGGYTTEQLVESKRNDYSTDQQPPSNKLHEEQRLTDERITKRPNNEFPH